VSALPLGSTATQNDTVGHDTEATVLPVSILAGVAQVDPSNVTTLPL
jgi:hypothetical protein